MKKLDNLEAKLKHIEFHNGRGNKQEIGTTKKECEELVEELRSRAKDALTTLALAQEESFEGLEPAEDLLALEGLEREMAFKLAAKGVVTLEDLADQGTDEIEDIEGLTEERAGELIMAARNICWFGDEE